VPLLWRHLASRAAMQDGDGPAEDVPKSNANRIVKVSSSDIPESWKVYNLGLTVARYSYAAPWLWARSHGQRRLWCLTYPVTVSGVLQLQYEQGWPQLAQTGRATEM
jgi:hypothetical protein